MNWDQGVWDSGTWDSGPTTIFLPNKKRKTKHKTMAANPTPDDDAVLKALAEDLADGDHDHEVAIGIKQNTEAVIRAAITAFDTAKMARGVAEQTLADKYGLLQTADTAGAVVLRNCKLRLVKLFGSQYNAQWQTAGWPSGTTAIPDSQDGRFSLLGSLKNYFTAVPASESADMEATAAICTTAHTGISNARAAVNAGETALVTAKENEKAGVRTLRKRVRGLIDELGTLIAEDDPRWEAFGLNIPANPTAPEGIADLTVTPQAGGKLHLLWTYATRMTGTRLLTRRMTGAVVDEDFQSAGTADGLEKTLTGFVAGVTVRVKVIPYNDGGDGAESPTREVVVV
jgi:hypothetical protein